MTRRTKRPIARPPAAMLPEKGVRNVRDSSALRIIGGTMRGRKILYTPDVEIVHLRGRSAESAPGQTRRAYRQSQLAFYEKHHPGWAPLLRLYLRLRGQL